MVLGALLQLGACVLAEPAERVPVPFDTGAPTDPGEPAVDIAAVLAAHEWTELSASWATFAAWSPDGTAVCSLCDGLTSLSVAPQPFAAVGASFQDAFGVTEDGEIVSWFDEDARVPPGGDYVDVGAGASVEYGEHVCGLDTRGQVRCVAQGGVMQTDSPLGDGYFALEVDDYGACVLSEGGIPSCWGNVCGGADSLGDLQGVAQISLSIDVTCVRFESGEATCWRDTRENLLIAPPGPWLELAAAWHFACGIQVGGTIACWWDNAPAPPILATTQETFRSIACGAGDCCAIRDDNDIRCWGTGFGFLED